MVEPGGSGKLGAGSTIVFRSLRHQGRLLRATGLQAVLLVSAELDEIMALSDRIAVMYQGQIIETLPAESATREQLGLLLGVIENYASGLFGTQWKDFAAFAVLVVLLMFRPTGLLGESLGRARA